MCLMLRSVLRKFPRSQVQPPQINWTKTSWFKITKWFISQDFHVIPASLNISRSSTWRLNFTRKKCLPLTRVKLFLEHFLYCFASSHFYTNACFFSTISWREIWWKPSLHSSVEMSIKGIVISKKNSSHMCQK